MYFCLGLCCWSLGHDLIRLNRNALGRKIASVQVVVIRCFVHQLLLVGVFFATKRSSEAVGKLSGSPEWTSFYAFVFIMWQAHGGAGAGMLTWRESILVSVYNVVVSAGSIMTLYWNPGTYPTAGVQWDVPVFIIACASLLHLFSTKLRSVEDVARVEWSKKFRAEHRLVDEIKYVTIGGSVSIISCWSE